MQAIIFSFKEKFSEKDYDKFDRIRKILEGAGFQWVQGNLYVNTDEMDGYRHVYNVVDKLKKNEWFREKVRDVNVFRMTDWSDLTEEITGTPQVLR